MTYDPRAASSAVATTPDKEYVLAPEREWRVTTGVGKSALTVEAAGAGKPDRVYVTYAPVGPGRVQRTPLMAVYAPLDAGDLDGSGACWIVDRDADGVMTTATGVIYVTLADAEADTASAVAAALKAEREAVAAKAAPKPAPKPAPAKK